ncbi:uncharacterized protein [Ambystoma mexicanum]|uniref:uncharacterized protein n=1 Tax=Ambystoma mexicanum TaxID=8296 RepID=UPI0037E82BCC
MGAAFAPSLAILFMSNFENQHILCESNPFQKSISNWKRYIDDIIFIWEGLENELLEFFSWLNQIDTNIQFTLEYSKNQVIFLDLIIKHQDGELKCCLHRKPSARNTLLHYTSDHPRHLKDNLPYGQYLRIRRNCTDLYDFNQQADELDIRFRDRGYPRSLIKRSRKRALFTDRALLLTNKTPQSEAENMTCVLTHGIKAFEVKKIILKHWDIVRLDLPEEPPPRFAFKRAPNIRDKLIHSRFRNTTPRTGLWDLRSVKGHYPCGSCSVCSFTKKMRDFRINERIWTLPNLTNCKTKNVVYCIECPCGLRYVGQTSRAVHVRIAEHRSRIRCKIVTAPLVNHYLTLKHSPNNIVWWVLEAVQNSTNIQKCLLDREARWIFRLGTHIRGLNEEFIPPF